MAEDDLYSSLSTDFLVPTNKDIGAIALNNGGTRHNFHTSSFRRSKSKYPDGKCTYLCGNSLGLLSKTSSAEIQGELNVWGTR